MLVLDDIMDLSHPDFEGYFRKVSRPTPLHRAMPVLSLKLQQLHGVRDCFLCCTGHSLWLFMHALPDTWSPLLVTPVLLQPLSARDVLEALRLTSSSSSGGCLLADMHVAPGLAQYFASTAVRLRGEWGRALQFLLRDRQHAARLHCCQKRRWTQSWSGCCQTCPQPQASCSACSETAVRQLSLTATCPRG